MAINPAATNVGDQRSPNNMVANLARGLTDLEPYAEHEVDREMATHGSGQPLDDLQATVSD